MPLEEAFERHARVGLLLRRLPGRVEGERVPHGVQAFHEHGEVGRGVTGGHLVGEDVHHVAEALGRGRGRVRLHLAAEEPLEGAGVGQLVEGTAGERDGLVPVAQRHLALGRVPHAPPAIRVRGRHQGAAVLVGEGGEAGQPAGGGLPAEVRDAGIDRVVARSSATSAPTARGRRGRPVTSAGSTPSSVRNREGWSPSSAGAFTAVTTSRSRARVAAT